MSLISSFADAITSLAGGAVLSVGDTLSRERDVLHFGTQEPKPKKTKIEENFVLCGTNSDISFCA